MEARFIGPQLEIKLARMMGRFEKSEVKLHCVARKESLGLFRIIWGFETPRVREIEVAL